MLMYLFPPSYFLPELFEGTSLVCEHVWIGSLHSAVHWAPPPNLFWSDVKITRKLFFFPFLFIFWSIFFDWQYLNKIGSPQKVMLKMILHFLPNKYFVSPPAATPILVRKINIGLVAWELKLLAASTQFVSNLTLDVSRVPKQFGYNMFSSTFS